MKWHDVGLIPHLNSSNALDYFCSPSNPFYDRQCNNSIIKMNNFPPTKMLLMTGKEYVLHHAQEPILYVIREQNRISPTEAITTAEFYICNGVVYQAPDLHSVIYSRLANTINNVSSALTEALSLKYRDYKGADEADPSTVPANAESRYQGERVDHLVKEFAEKFGVKKPARPEKSGDAAEEGTSAGQGSDAASDRSSMATKQEMAKL